MAEALISHQLREAAQTHDTALVLYLALEIFLNAQQRSLAVITALESAYHNEGKLSVLLTNLRQWWVALEARIDLVEALHKGSPEQAMMFYQSKMHSQSDYSEAIILENFLNSLRSVVVATQANLGLMKSTLPTEPTEIGILEQQIAIFANTHQFLRAYLAEA